MKSFGFIFGVVISIIILAAGYHFHQEIYEQTLLEIEQNTNTSGNTSDPFALTSAVLEPPAEWVSFESEEYGYSLKHPADITAETTSEGDRFFKLGPTQSEGTELYDGISLIIRSDDLKGKTLEEYAKSQRDLMAAEETTQSITALLPVAFGTHQGFMFRKSSLGDADFIYLIMPNARYLEVINGTVEPENREQTFQNITNMIISSIRF